MDLRSAGHAILKHLRKRSGAAFGATLYRDLVLFGATGCDVDNMSMSFIMCMLFVSVRGGARWFSKPKNGLKIRRPQGRGGSNPPPGTN